MYIIYIMDGKIKKVLKFYILKLFNISHKKRVKIY